MVLPLSSSHGQFISKSLQVIVNNELKACSLHNEVNRFRVQIAKEYVKTLGVALTEVVRKLDAF
jgi:hypothetical protein